MLHLRPLKPDEPEMVPEEKTVPYYELHDEKGKALNEWVHWDMETGLATKGPKPKAKKMVPTGSMKQVDEFCTDCGAALANGLSESFRYLVCGRLSRYRPYGTVINRIEDGKTLHVLVVDDEDPKPKPNTVIECGRLGLEDES